MMRRRCITSAAERTAGARKRSSGASSGTSPAASIVFSRRQAWPLDRDRSLLAISLAIHAAQSGRRVYFGTLADLIASLEEAKAAGRFPQRLKVLTHPSLLIVDEIGYLPITQTGAMVFFQLMTRRYERASTMLTSNKSFEEWGEIFGDEVMAAALIDRLLHHCHLVNIRGNSYRMRQHSELWRRRFNPRPRTKRIT